VRPRQPDAGKYNNKYILYAKCILVACGGVKRIILDF
jgi:hypothetical protein